MRRTLSALTIAAVVLAAGVIAGSAASPYSRNRSNMIHRFYCAHIQLIENNARCRNLLYIAFNSCGPKADLRVIGLIW